MMGPRFIGHSSTHEDQCLYLCRGASDKVFPPGYDVAELVSLNN